MKIFKKVLAMVFGFSLIGGMVACGDNEKKGERVTKEEWNAAFETTLAAENMTMKVEFETETGRNKRKNTGVFKIADGKHYNKITLSQTTDGVKNKSTQETYIGEVDGVSYEWNRVVGEDWQCQVSTAENYATGYYALASLLGEEILNYSQWYDTAKFEKDSGEYDIVVQGDDFPYMVEVKIRKGAVYSLEIEGEYYDGENMQTEIEEKWELVFTDYGKTKVGDLPKVTD